MRQIQELNSLFASVFDIDANTDFENLEYRGIPQWDSAAHLRLIAALESEFNIMLATEDVLDMSSFKKAVEILQRYDVEFQR